MKSSSVSEGAETPLMSSRALRISLGHPCVFSAATLSLWMNVTLYFIHTDDRLYAFCNTNPVNCDACQYSINAFVENVWKFSWHGPWASQLMPKERHAATVALTVWFPVYSPWGIRQSTKQRAELAQLEAIKTSIRSGEATQPHCRASTLAYRIPVQAQTWKSLTSYAKLPTLGYLDTDSQVLRSFSSVLALLWWTMLCLHELEVTIQCLLALLMRL